MTLQHSVAVRNARLDAIETTIGASPFLRIRSGAPPANCAAARQGTVLATVALPADWTSDAAAGQKAMAGTWQDLLADAAGTAGHYEIMDNGLTTCHEQGTITATGGGGDMELNNTVLAVGQEFSVDSYTLTEGNE